MLLALDGRMKRLKSCSRIDDLTGLCWSNLSQEISQRRQCEQQFCKRQSSHWILLFRLSIFIFKSRARYSFFDYGRSLTKFPRHRFGSSWFPFLVDVLAPATTLIILGDCGCCIRSEAGNPRINVVFQMRCFCSLSHYLLRRIRSSSSYWVALKGSRVFSVSEWT